MRRVPRLQDALAQPAAAIRPTPLAVELRLRLLTPMIGGGVRPLEPDVQVPVRVTGLRGALRWWWRVLQVDETDCNRLRAREGQIFGAVANPQRGAAGREKDADGNLATALRLEVEPLKPPRVVPAGTHEASPKGPKAMPTWTVGDLRLGYALFPLQRTLEERNTWAKTRRDAQPTREVAVGLEFTLRLGLDPARAARRGLGPPVAEEVLHALRWWLHWGGLGARTRRGFGAVEGVEILRLEGAGLDLARWRKALLEPPLDTRELHRARPPADRPSLAEAQILLGPVGRADRAHADAVGALQTFRQREGFARDTGSQPNSPGRSRWPEADRLKAEAQALAEPRRLPFAHRPFTEDLQEARRLPTPRVAFGMPVLIQFKDKGDRAANGQLVPVDTGGKRNGSGRTGGERTGAKDTDRWASPVILRPIGQGGAWAAGVLILHGAAVPRRARVKLDSDRGERGASEAPAVGSAGAREAVFDRLDAAGGDALRAWVDFLRTKQHFEVMP